VVDEEDHTSPIFGETSMKYNKQSQAVAIKASQAIVFTLLKGLFLATVIVLFHVTLANAKPYTVDQEQSAITFQGEHTGMIFEGQFNEWSADIVFDPASLDTSSINVVIQTGSAETGNAQYDGTLPNTDWFDTSNHPQATFTSTSIESAGDGRYTVTGDLTIKDVTQPVSFDFTLSGLDSPPVEAQGTFIIDRLAYNIGTKSDPTADWVSKDINMTIQIVATPE
jgi:polyisoprenoid-binding protein YceI